jgi:hypothetical protein
MTNEISQETQDMLTIVDRYESGDLNLEEAIDKISTYAPLGDDRIAEILLGVERENILKFPEPRSDKEVEIADDDEACSKSVFTFTAEFDLDEPA